MIVPWPARIKEKIKQVSFLAALGNRLLEAWEIEEESRER